jgi:hypothetical protein
MAPTIIQPRMKRLRKKAVNSTSASYDTSRTMSK